jgi:hypothetical protein
MGTCGCPFFIVLQMVPRRGLEPPHLTAPEPKSGASTNFATWAAALRAGILADLRLSSGQLYLHDGIIPHSFSHTSRHGSLRELSRSLAAAAQTSARTRGGDLPVCTFGR